MAKVILSKELAEKLAGLPHVKKAWVSDDGKEYHLTQPMKSNGKLAATAKPGWNEAEVNGGEVATEVKKSYGKMTVADLTAECIKREITVDDDDKKADLIGKLEEFDADPNNQLG